MTTKLYSVYDNELEEFTPPFTAKNIAIAIRYCRNMKIPNDLKKNLILNCIGSLDLETGIITQSAVKKEGTLEELLIGNEEDERREIE